MNSNCSRIGQCSSKCWRRAIFHKKMKSVGGRKFPFKGREYINDVQITFRLRSDYVQLRSDCVQLMQKLRNYYVKKIRFFWVFLGDPQNLLICGFSHYVLVRKVKTRGVFRWMVPNLNVKFMRWAMESTPGTVKKEIFVHFQWCFETDRQITC